MEKLRIIEITNKALEVEFEIDPQQLVPEANVRTDLGLDSLDIVDMVIVLEKAFQIKLTNKKDLATLHTLGDIYNFLEALRESGIDEK